MPFDIDITQTPTYQEGKLEGKLTTATAMLIDKMPIAQIIKFTGLTLAQINALQAELDNKK